MPDAINLEVPVTETAIRSLHVGDAVTVSGVVVTARDVAHKYMCSTMIRRKPAGGDLALSDRLQLLLNGSFIYHCGPVMRQEGARWQCAAGGPTTSIREEPYEADVIRAFGLRGIIGKGGMGADTQQALNDCGAVYLHAVGGAAVVAAEAVAEVKEVFRLDFGMPEAFWVLELKAFPAIVTMDTHGKSLHADIEKISHKALEHLMRRD